MFAESVITNKKTFGIMRIITDAFGICKMLFGIHQRAVEKNRERYTFLDNQAKNVS